MARIFFAIMMVGVFINDAQADDSKTRSGRAANITCPDEQESCLVIETASYRITNITCPEYVVSCEGNPTILENKITGKTKTVYGKTMHTTCKDGVTPCKYLGYKFSDGRFEFYLWADYGDRDFLTVHKDEKKVLRQRILWREHLGEDEGSELE